MSTSKRQREKIAATCQCGCGETFFPFPLYRPKAEGGGLRVPEYKRGHHPNAANRKGIPSWNAGLTKAECPTLARMGFQPGHPCYSTNIASGDMHRRLATEPELREKWLKAKRTQVPWNKGKDKTAYDNGIKSGPEHGNWCGGKRGIRDTAQYKTFCNEVRKRDNWTCQHCGDRNRKGRGSRIRLEVHHIEEMCHAPERTMDLSNVVTLCAPCHRKTDNYGTKVVHRRRKQSGKT